MKTKRNKFDIFVVFFIFALLFTVGFHIGKDEDSAVKGSLYAGVCTKKTVGEPYVGEVCYIDERYPVTAFSVQDGIIVFSCEGDMLEAGFLLDGAKYISENQPVRIFWESGFCEGRIISLGELPVTKTSCFS